MEDTRKQVIVNEIHYWKNHQLLPKEYCDFLLALYTEGEEDRSSDKKAFPYKSWFTFVCAMILLSLLPSSFLVIYFTEISMLMQTGLHLIFLTFSALGYWYFKKANSIYVHIAIIVFLLIVFIFSVYVVQMKAQQMVLLHITILINCILWIFIGVWKKVFYLIASGIIGFVMWLLFIFF
ncbi:hypothetical protein N780_05035 [Pontibacillus chungwhensis BH030062]|uniref:Uncharacterized protein n=1 Tax=Pontibacillus chungwhensis BH030062 TaxID=1385513 RepID=A0A0A2UUT0_9BACI|nr:hypothetical protein [Pontibacillus chungwhensis]KGP90508.1 hypothetical protein N780_05035 [Pontibacillus chungwhensis BH030062]